ncbi:ATP-binding protein [Lutibaculum baratangense]|uniref:histidine kinase n=1 Tax=Lutibaculum baratangense AMV1 TaxID=631454 RepID=V4RHR5_9HYPH|nr:ATP-binding protein [Lutibaculum baratangense]ESR22810.1 periplasmic sensor signal transduction histidine kinase [Lutibaculum baratangense AMV1]
MAQAEEPAARGWRQKWDATSLAFRLFLLATGWSLLALLVAGVVLSTWYRSTVERGFQTLLDVYSLNLVASVEQNEGGLLSGTPNLGEPRFSSFQSGWYWQVQVAGSPGPGIGSPSLAGSRLEMPPPRDAPYDREFRRDAVIEGPGGRSLLAVERVVIFDTTGDRLNFLVAGDLGDVEAELTAFRNRLIIVFAVLGAGLVTISVAQVRVGLRPLRRLRLALSAIREGEAAHLEGEYPPEIMPLVRELNGLMAANTKIIERARTHVGNLAHALKTPLSVLMNEARADGGRLSGKVLEQSAIMRHQLDLYLERARMAGRTRVLGATIEVKPVLDALARTMERIHEDRGISVVAECPERVRFQGEQQDLEEILGNLVDNACKWARALVRVEVRPVGQSQIEIVIDDDGAGLAAGQREEALKRGRRLDTSRPGSGLGLSIVSELVELYEGSLTLEEAPGRGLRARVVLPRA